MYSYWDYANSLDKVQLPIEALQAKSQMCEKLSKSDLIYVVMVLEMYERSDVNFDPYFELPLCTQLFLNRSTNASAESFNAKVKAFRSQFRGVRNTEYFLYRLIKLYS